MKIKNKILLAASGLLVLSAAAAGTGTYAWFVANNSGTLGTTFHAASNNPELKFTVTPTDTVHLDGGLAEAGSLANITPVTANGAEKSADSKLTDVSSNGKTFWKASLSNGSVDSLSNKTTPYTVDGMSSTSTAPYYYEFALTFSHTLTNLPMAVFLSSGSSITAVTATGEGAAEQQDKNDKLAGCMRAAIVDSTKNNLLAYYAPNETIDNTYKFYDGADKTTNHKELNATNLGLVAAGYEQNLLDRTYNTDVTDMTYQDDTTNATSTKKGYLGTLAANNGTLTVYLRIWIEGEDADCDNTAIDGVVNAQFKFNGVTAIRS